MSMPVLLCLFVVVAYLPGCHTDPVCVPGTPHARAADCMRRMAEDCGRFGFTDDCVNRWDQSCDAEDELYTARCTQ